MRRMVRLQYFQLEDPSGVSCVVNEESRPEWAKGVEEWSSDCLGGSSALALLEDDPNEGERASASKVQNPSAKGEKGGRRKRQTGALTFLLPIFP